MKTPFTYASQVPLRNREWLWENRIPFGALTIIEGYPGQGKSLFVVDLAARVTRGAAMPLDTKPRKPAGVVYLVGEEDWEYDVAPRLAAARADRKRIRCSKVEMLDDVEQLATEIRDVKAKVIIVDPLLQFLPCGIAWGDNARWRQKLKPLRDLAQATRVAIVVVRHFTKNASGNAHDRGEGPRAFGAMARGVHYVTTMSRAAYFAARALAGSPVEDANPNGPDFSFISPVKVNGAPRAALVPLNFSIIGTPLKIGGKPSSQPIADDWRESMLSREDVEKISAQEQKREKGELARAKKWLATQLAGGDVAATDIAKEAEEEGISERTLMRAKADLGVRSVPRYTDGKRASWWTLKQTKAAKGAKNAKAARGADGRLPGKAGTVGGLPKAARGAKAATLH